MQVEKDVYVPMRDGVCMALDLYKPDKPGRYPAIVTRTPYIKDASLMAGPSVAERMQPWVEAGYVMVVSDTRGTGVSEGVYDYYNYENGPWDGYDTIEWAAHEPWCDGNVGVMGASASAILAYNAAIRRPPSLKAIAANMHPADQYFDQWFVGGVFRYENRIGWAVHMLPRIAPAQPLNPKDPAFARKHKVYMDRVAQYYERMRRGENPANLDWLTEGYSHRTYDAFWKKRSMLSGLAEVSVPALHGGVWFDHFIRGTLATHEAVNVPKKLSVSAGSLHGGMLAPDRGYDDLAHRWFDYYLRGVENGVVDVPGARLYLMGEDRWIEEPRWPVPAEEMTLFLAPGPGGGSSSLNDGLLCADAPGSGEPSSIDHDPAHPNRTVANPTDQRPFEGRALTFSTPPLDRAVTVIGTPRLRFFASSDAADVDWCVRLCNVYPDGRSQLLNTGALKASHVFSHESPQPLEKDRIYEFEVEVWAVANVFKRGHRIRIDISTSDFPFFECNPLASRNRVYHDAAHPSRLVLPVVKG
jgi:putative CocE/NonD family hydrolase